MYTSSETEILEELIHISEEDTILGMSFPRYSSKAVKTLHFAHSRRAKVIAITDSLLSPIADFATCLLLAHSDMATIVDSLVAPLSVLNALIVAVSLRRMEQNRETLNELEGLWETYQVYQPFEKRRTGCEGAEYGIGSARHCGGRRRRGADGGRMRGRRGRPVTVVERNPRPARKVLITGKGRCNVTNNCTAEDAVAHVPGGGRFLYSAFFRLHAAGLHGLVRRTGRAAQNRTGRPGIPGIRQSDGHRRRAGEICQDGRRPDKAGRVSSS